MVVLGTPMIRGKKVTVNREHTHSNLSPARNGAALERVPPPGHVDALGKANHLADSTLRVGADADCPHPSSDSCHGPPVAPLQTLLHPQKLESGDSPGRMQKGPGVASRRLKPVERVVHASERQKAQHEAVRAQFGLSRESCPD
jgi:hypothetical protein